MAEFKVSPDAEYADGNPFSAQVAFLEGLDNRFGSICVRPPVSLGDEYVDDIRADKGIRVTEWVSTNFGTIFDFEIIEPSDETETNEGRLESVTRSILRYAGRTANVELFAKDYQARNKD